MISSSTHIARPGILGSWFGLICFVLMLEGCSVIPQPTEDPTRFFVLTTPAPVEQGLVEPKETGKKIGFLSVDLPGYLRNDRKIVVRNGKNEIVYRDYARWAEPLDVGLARVLKERLQATDGVALVVSPPFAINLVRDYDVSVHVIRCEGILSPEGTRSVGLIATFDIFAVKDGQLIARKTFKAPGAEWKDGDFSRLAELVSEAAAKLASEIAAALPR